MEKLLEHARTTLAEEERLIGHLTELARQTRQAILDRSLDDLVLIGARHQNAIVRLEITRQSQLRLLDSRLNDRQSRACSIEDLFKRIGSEEDVRRVRELKKRIEELRGVNTQNSILLEKQLASVRAFGQVMDLLCGIDKVYDRNGHSRRVHDVPRIEEMR